MFKVFKQRELRNKLFKLIIPFFLQELVVVLTTTFSTIILGWSGASGNEVAAVGLGFQIFFLFNMIVLSIAFIGTLFISQHFGANKLDEVEKDYHLFLKLVFSVSVIFLILCLTIPSQLISLFTPSSETIEIATNYLRLFSISFVPTSVSVINYLLIKNMCLEKYGTVSSVITFAFTLLFSVIFIIACNFGVKGAALAIVISRFIELIVTSLIIYIKSPAKFRFKKLFVNDIERLKTFIAHGAPLFLGKFSWALGLVFMSIVIAQIQSGDTNKIITANQLMITAENIALCLSNAISGAVGVTLGRELGANKLDVAERYGDDLQKFLLLSGLINVIIFLALLPIVIFMNKGAVDEVTKDYLWRFFLIQAGMFIPRMFNAIYQNGIFNVGGEQIYIACVDGLPYWLFVIPLGYLGARLNWDPILIFAILQTEEIVKFPFNLIHYQKKKWLRNVNKKEVTIHE